MSKDKVKKPSSLRVLSAVFLSGATVMIMELTGTRLFAPFIGSSIFTWTSLIGVILACMSVGYYLGGVKADKNPSWNELSRICFIAALSVAFVVLSSTPVLAVLSNMNLDIRLKGVLASLVLFSLPSVLLGMILPFCVRLSVSDISTSGKTVGSLYAFSTFGSITGTFLGGFFLISYFGSLSIYLLCSLLLIVASILFSLESNLYLRISTFFLISYFLFFTSQKIAFALLDTDTRYHRVIVNESEENGRKVRWLLTDPLGAQSAAYVDNFDELYSSYAKKIITAISLLDEKKEFLVIGGGAYSIPKYLLSKYPESKVMVVEIDSVLTEIAVDYFGLKSKKNLEVIHEDARMFINSNETSSMFDVIVFDVFSSSPSIPFHLVTQSSFSRLLRKLNHQGLFAMNIISSIEGEKRQLLDSIVSTLKLSIQNISIYKIDPEREDDEAQNIVLFASDSKEVIDEIKLSLNSKPLALHDSKVILTDDFSPIEKMYLPLFE